MTLGINNYPDAFWNAYSTDASNVCAGVNASRPYANSLRVVVVTMISDVDVIASTGNA